ncbi:putative LuxR family transcriptional regulator [Actinacidiphila reveromycinica]|uniref:Putative LuxR family transcriptional regulator n=1 Tax=Actinacidiphila reveromycinica TaxID=659352 RepID=A0A7U3UXX8_9ACTN|nr:helix-turn-helix transcriptional regulator [Streptomyces sp. SN-593]BBB00908.1 putative LuxR family transcriptional regulator [Streptomyces sp. SN-593]
MRVNGRGESVEVRAALLRMRRSGLLPVSFGGLVAGGGGLPVGYGARQFRISELAGTATEALRGLAITTGNGLGGKTLAMGRPYAVTEYRDSRVISHEYDAAVASEGLRSVLAVPVVVQRRVRGVLYGALRQPFALGDRPLNVALDAARELEQALVIRDEAQRLLSFAQAPLPADPRAWEEVREAHAELRALAGQVPDARLREELLSACIRLAAAGAPPQAPRTGPAPGAPQLTPRELDVLSSISSGATNAAAAARLRLRPETVKSYLRSAMRKLGAHTRLEAVVAARRAGLLP